MLLGLWRRCAGCSRYKPPKLRKLGKRRTIAKRPGRKMRKRGRRVRSPEAKHFCKLDRLRKCRLSLVVVLGDRLGGRF